MNKIKKQFLMILIFILVAFISIFYEKSYLNYNNYYMNTIELEKNIVFLSKFPKKIRVDIFGLDEICQEYLDTFFIKVTSEKNLNSNILIKVFSRNKKLDNCNLKLTVSDPYGNLLKKIILQILPLIIIFFLFFKILFFLMLPKNLSTQHRYLLPNTRKKIKNKIIFNR